MPSVAAPVVLAPTIDAIELEGARSFVSGSGPAGALMRLFADDEVVGESPVEEGRWLVETGPLLTAPKRELKVQEYSVSNRGLRPNLIGTPEQIRQRIADYQGVGLDLVLLQLSPQAEEMERFAAEVIRPGAAVQPS